jgi:hypothetical protein
VQGRRWQVGELVGELVGLRVQGRRWQVGELVGEPGGGLTGGPVGGQISFHSQFEGMLVG